VLRLAEPDPGPSQPSSDDLEALANAVREAARAPRESRQAAERGDRRGDGHPDSAIPAGRRAHLRALPNPER
jgi:hypothetical protein